MPVSERGWPQLLSLAVHELRTPVNVVSGYVRMLLGGHGGGLSDAQRHALEAADQANARVIALLGELSEVARLEDGRLVLSLDPVPAADLLHDASAGFVPPLGDHTRCVVTGEVPAIAVAADRQRTARAISALAAAVARQHPGAGIVGLQAGRQDAFLAVEVTAARTRHESPDPPALEPLPEFEGGLGVSLPLARLVVESSGGRLGALPGGQDSPGLVVLLPVA